MPNILIAAVHWPVASGRYMADAFRRIGCNVRTVGPAMGNSIWGMEIDPKHNWNGDYSHGSRIEDYPVAPILKDFAASGFVPDLIVTMDTMFDLKGKPQEFPCPKVVYGMDNHVSDYRRYPDQWFDHYFLAHHDGPMLPVSNDPARRHTWLPCAYDPVYFRPSLFPMVRRRYDVTIIGYPYDMRQAIIKAMTKAGLKTYSGLGPVYDEYARIYHDSKIALCNSALGDLGQRVFEGAAMGCCILTDECPDLERLHFHNGIQGRIYHNVKEAVNIAQQLLIPDALGVLEGMAHAGQLWAQPHTWDNRCRTILETMELL